MVTGAEQARDEIGVLLEIDTIYGRIRRKAGAIEDQELESPAQRKLPAPGRTSSDDAPVDEHQPLHRTILRGVTNSSHFRLQEPGMAVTSSLICSGRMTPDAASSPHSLATASGLLMGALGAAMVVGALVGWLFGAAALGLLVGAVLGIPLGVLVVYQVYGRTRT